MADQEPQTETPAPDGEERYRRKLLWLLSVATFFEGYDNFVLAFVLSLILADLGGTEAQAGLVRGITTIGTVAAFFLAAQADRIGRKRLLLITIVGYTIATVATALSPGLVALTAAQFVSQFFLGAEWAVAITIVVEEFPVHVRGKSLGIVTSMNTLGGIFVGVLAFLGLQNTRLDWRAFYLVGVIPLIAVFLARRGMRETVRYEAVRTSEAAEKLDTSSLWEPWRPDYRRAVLGVGLMHFFRFLVISAAVFWWPYYAQHEVGMSVSLTGLYLALAGIVGAVGFILGGRAMDRWGRRPVFLLYTFLAGVFGVVLFQTSSPLVMLPLLCLGIFFGLGSACMTSAFATESFPTYVRSRAAAWCRNAFEVPGGIIGAPLVGWLGDHQSGPLGSIGDAMSFVFVACLIPCLFIAWRYIRETKDVNLEALDEAVAYEATMRAL